MQIEVPFPATGTEYTNEGYLIERRLNNEGIWFRPSNQFTDLYHAVKTREDILINPLVAPESVRIITVKITVSAEVHA